LAQVKSLAVVPQLLGPLQQPALFCAVKPHEKFVQLRVWQLLPVAHVVALTQQPDPAAGATAHIVPPAPSEAQVGVEQAAPVSHSGAGLPIVQQLVVVVAGWQMLLVHLATRQLPGGVGQSPSIAHDWSPERRSPITGGVDVQAARRAASEANLSVIARPS
jgi:hypothetical protein